MSDEKKFPWYRERLKAKYANDVNPTLNHRNWTFVKTGLDDFRDGMPPDFVKYTTGPSKSTGPSVRNKPPIGQIKEIPASKKKSTKLDVYERFYSKRIPAAERRRRRVEALEKNLKDHPLALFPDLENGLTPELYEEIVDILDPELLEYPEDNFTETLSENDDGRSEIEVNIPNSTDTTTTNGEPSLPLDRLFRKKGNPADHIKTLELERHEKKVKEIAEDFISWADVLGPEGPTLGSDTIQALFTSGYTQSKPLASAVKIVELNSIPPELRAETGMAPSADVSHLPDNVPHVSSRPQIGYRYGAWYLKPESWKLAKKSDPLIDPTKFEEEEDLEPSEHDKDLAKLHGAQTFRSFLEKHNTKVPSFMKDVIAAQDYQEEPKDNTSKESVDHVTTN